MAQIRMEIICNNATEAALVLAGIANAERLAQGQFDDGDGEATGADQQQPSAEAKPRRTRRAKGAEDPISSAQATTSNANGGAAPEPISSAQTTTAAEPAPAKEPEATAAALPTVDDARMALQSVVETFDMDRATKLVLTQGYERVTVMPPSFLPTFIAACKAACAGNAEAIDAGYTAKYGAKAVEDVAAEIMAARAKAA